MSSSFTEVSRGSAPAIPLKPVSRRRLMVGLAGGGALTTLGGLVLVNTLHTVLPVLTGQPLGIPDSIFMSWSTDLTRVASTPIENIHTTFLWDYTRQQISGTFYWPDVFALDEICSGWSPDGRKLLQAAGRSGVASDLANVVCWDIQMQSPIYTLANPHLADVNQVIWSPDGESVAIVGSATLLVLSASDGRELFFRQYAGAITALAWNSSGQQLALLLGNDLSHALTLLIWDAGSRQQITRQFGPDLKYDSSDNQMALAWLSGTRELVIVASKQLWLTSADSNTYLPLGHFPNFTNSYLIAISPDSAHLVVSDEGQLALWNLKNRQFERAFFRGSLPSYIRALNWLNNSQIAIIDKAYNRVVLSR